MGGKRVEETRLAPRFYSGSPLTKKRRKKGSIDLRAYLREGKGEKRGMIGIGVSDRERKRTPPGVGKGEENGGEGGKSL